MYEFIWKWFFILIKAIRYKFVIERSVSQPDEISSQKEMNTKFWQYKWKEPPKTRMNVERWIIWTLLATNNTTFAIRFTTFLWMIFFAFKMAFALYFAEEHPSHLDKNMITFISIKFSFFSKAIWNSPVQSKVRREFNISAKFLNQKCSQRNESSSEMCINILFVCLYIKKVILIIT